MSRPTRGHGSRFPVRGCHPLRPAFPGASGTKNPCHWPVPRSLATTCGISRSVLSPRPVLMSVPPATEMFQFAGFASSSYEFRRGYPLPGGLPHSDIPGSPIARISPGLFAACHVLRRLSVPRHPPDALTLRLIPGVSATEIQWETPHKTAAHRGKTHAIGGPHMKTLLRTHPARLRRACPPRSHDKLSLHPSNNTPPGSPRDGVRNLLQTPDWCRPDGARMCPDGGGERISNR